MSVLHISPDSHVLVHAATAAVLYLHIGATVAPFLPTPERASVIAGVLTFYLALSSWAAVKRKPGQIGAFDYVLLLTALTMVGYSATLRHSRARALTAPSP